MAATDWLTPFLPLLRCPASGLSLRPATPEEKEARGLPSEAEALVSGDGAHWYPIELGIPVLLPSGGDNMP
jgi:uncharacterized protein YbaR (Trm112 family)